MSDYLYINTANARTAATQLQSMATSGADHATGVRRACALAELADTTSARLESVADALADLSRVLNERSDAADAGGLLPYRSTSVPLANITESLYGYTPPTVEELFPPIGPQTTRPADDPAANPRCSVDDQSSFPWDRLLDPLLPIMEPLIDQPIMPRAWWDVAGDGLSKAWDVAGVGVSNAWDAVESAGHEVEDHLTDLDWSAAERFVERVEEAASNPVVLAGTLAGAPLLPLEVASHYGILGVSMFGYGLAYTRAGDGEARFGLTVPIGGPSFEQFLPTANLTLTSDVPESGLHASVYVCDVVCGGVVLNDDGSIAPSFGFGALGVQADAGITTWGNPFSSDD